MGTSFLVSCVCMAQAGGRLGMFLNFLFPFVSATHHGVLRRQHDDIARLHGMNTTCHASLSPQAHFLCTHHGPLRCQLDDLACLHGHQLGAALACHGLAHLRRDEHGLGGGGADVDAGQVGEAQRAACKGAHGEVCSLSQHHP